MGLFGLVSLIISVLRQLPGIIKLVREIMDLFSSLRGKHEHTDREILLELVEALKQVRTVGDLSGIAGLQKKLEDTLNTPPKEVPATDVKKSSDSSIPGGPSDLVG